MGTAPAGDGDSSRARSHSPFRLQGAGRAPTGGLRAAARAQQRTPPPTPAPRRAPPPAARRLAGCWALCNLAWAFLRFPEAFAASNTTQRTLNSIKHEADFVVAARYEPGALVAYTSAPGGLKQSHDWWGRAEDITVRRGAILSVSVSVTVSDEEFGVDL